MLTLALIGCGGVEGTAMWSEGTGFSWELFNHRLSHLELGVDDDGGFASVIGGTSTTNVFTELDPGCEPDTCDEFPFIDYANVQVGWARTTTARAVFGVGTADLLVDADGEAASLTIDLPSRAKGSPVAVIRGFQFDTAQPLTGGPACYLPRNGWVPKGLGIALGEPSLADDGRSVTVEVSARFEAGPTNEAERACLDAVVDQARVAVRIDVLAAVGREPGTSVPVSAQAAYEYGSRSNPVEQPPPAVTAIDGDLSESLVGWSGWDFTFHEVGEERGAYVRTLALPVDATGGEANGVASNYSPGTQLSAFDYVFDGTLQVLDVGAPVERGSIDEQIEVELDDLGAPVVVRWALP
jgi:hypothetical protein